MVSSEDETPGVDSVRLSEAGDFVDEDRPQSEQRKTESLEAARLRLFRVLFLRAEDIAQETALEEAIGRRLRSNLERQLNPPDVSAKVQRALELVGSARLTTNDAILKASFSVIFQMLLDVRSLLPPYAKERNHAKRGDVRDRHANAAAAVFPASDLLAAHHALEEIAKTQSDNAAPHSVRVWLRHQSLIKLTDDEILQVVAVYRKPKAPEGKRSANQVCATATNNDRAEALAKLLGLEGNPSDIARRLRKELRSADARVKRLTGTPENSAK